MSHFGVHISGMIIIKADNDIDAIRKVTKILEDQLAYPIVSDAAINILDSERLE